MKRGHQRDGFVAPPATVNAARTSDDRDEQNTRLGTLPRAVAQQTARSQDQPSIPRAAISCSTGRSFAGISVVPRHFDPAFLELILGVAVDHKRWVGCCWLELAMAIPDNSRVERAFELARSGRCNTTEEVFRALEKEGHDARRVLGPYLMRQMRAVLHEALRVRRRS